MTPPAAAGNPDGEVRVAVGTARVRAASPVGGAAAVGVVFARLPADWPCSTACDHRGFAVQAEAGTDGAGVSVGWASVIGRRFRTAPWVGHVYVGWGIRATAVRTWDGPLGEPAGTRVGIEGAFTVAGASATLAVYRATAGPERGSWSVGGGLGWGF